MSLFVSLLTVYFCVGVTVIIFISFLDLKEKYEREKNDKEEPFITAYLHSHEQPNEFNCTDTKRITLNMTSGQDLDHRDYTFFLSPE